MFLLSSTYMTHFHIRVHFLMSGFVRYNLKSSDPDESQHAGAKINTDTDDRGLPQGLQLELRYRLFNCTNHPVFKVQ